MCSTDIIPQALYIINVFIKIYDNFRNPYES